MTKIYGRNNDFVTTINLAMTLIIDKRFETMASQADLPNLQHWACVTHITSQSYTHTHRCSNLTLQPIDLKNSPDCTIWVLFFKKFPGEHASDPP